LSSVFLLLKKIGVGNADFVPSWLRVSHSDLVSHEGTEEICPSASAPVESRALHGAAQPGRWSDRLASVQDFLSCRPATTIADEPEQKRASRIRPFSHSSPMRILLSGACGFVGSTLARAFAQAGNHQVYGFDSFIRPGSEINRLELSRLGVKLAHADLRQAADVDALPACDWVIDAAASPSVLAGIDGRTSSRQLVDHNLGGTVNLLEYCKRHRAGFILLSTSRVYSIPPLARLSVEVADNAFRPGTGATPPPGVTAAGVDETFATTAPVSLYGATKLASEALARPGYLRLLDQ
jgi:hypothetical protein